MMESYGESIERLRTFFASGVTRDVHTRQVHLRRLARAIISHEQEIQQALYADLHKSASESYLSEIGIVLDEIRFQLRHMASWAKAKRAYTPVTHFISRSYTIAEPYGLVLIMAPWNYPFNLCMVPLVGAIAAGNTVLLKPSAYASHTSEIVAQIVSEVFSHDYVLVVQGGRAENEQLLKQRYDYIFFTGSVAVGSLVMRQAAEHLTPVTLELGGKSPAVVDASADVSLAAKRIVFGKLLNAGQTCIAPDYVLVEDSVKETLINEMGKALKQYFPTGDLEDFPRIINQKHYDRLMQLLEGQQVIIGGKGDAKTRLIEPTILEPISADEPIMQEEIFGPLLPILSFTTIAEAIAFIKAREKPLALYVFTTRQSTEKEVVESLAFGGGCINDTIIHIANPRLPFGGVGNSGMGSYHGKASFLTFSHQKSVVKKSNLIDLNLRYHPYTKLKDRIIRIFLR
jgi:aldehyde dehydrogenase (NAD+)